jgi:hypothetical protein
MSRSAASSWVERHLLLAGGELSDKVVDSFANCGDSKRYCLELLFPSALKSGWRDRIGQ